MESNANALVHETSPYLLQHAHNPVNWQPWGEAALEQARRENKPILLSIGYSACHWCHVMEHESFEDEATAELMNELFVCIKVDREERPDLDKIYQTAHQMLVQRPGGWPLNMFLEPKGHMPIFGGTYFPKEPRHGMPPFTHILKSVAEVYANKPEDLEQQSAALRAAFERMQGTIEQGPLSRALLDAAMQQIAGQFDAEDGGFGSAPKFPHPMTIEFLLRRWHVTQDKQALHMALHTLDKMAQGGMYDQIGGGFCRYSVDGQWMIPHFEKMLYDNAQLIGLYAEAFVITGKDFYRDIVLQTANWLKREMTHNSGAFFSALDADSEGEEGKYYVWDARAIRQLVAEDEWQVLNELYWLEGTPNFEGHWHLHSHKTPAQVQDKLGISAGDFSRILGNAKQKLLNVRQQRTPPGLDDKILTSWNGLMIKGLAQAARLLDADHLADMAGRALETLRTQLWQDGRLHVTGKDGRAQLNAYLDDYVFVIDGILELLQVRWDTGHLRFAMELMDTVLEHFADPDQGGFYFTSDDHEQLLYRPKPVSDDAIPSGNGIAVRCLLHLGHLLGESRYLDAAERTLKGLAGDVARYPSVHCSLLSALDEYLDPGALIVLRGNPDELRKWQHDLSRAFAPGRIIFTIPAETNHLPGLLALRTPGGTELAYVCSGTSCQPPVYSLDQLHELLEGASHGHACPETVSN